MGVSGCVTPIGSGRKITRNLYARLLPGLRPEAETVSAAWADCSEVFEGISFCFPCTQEVFGGSVVACAEHGTAVNRNALETVCKFGTKGRRGWGRPIRHTQARPRSAFLAAQQRW